MQQFIENLSNDFLEEAKASPRMLQDLSAMEKYMSESYSGRTFVELIQNADDANSARVKVEFIGTTLLVANDGRCFNENDIMSICRSGASNKQRGNSIGYRGVGFKSATSISTEIVICSGGAYFTFSKSRCVKVLGMGEDRVPTVRIPFLYDIELLEYGVRVKIDELQREGYTTIFVFTNANMGKFSEEMEGFNSGWLLFLHHIEEVNVNIPGKKICVRVKRELAGTDTLISVDGEVGNWYIVENGGTAIAFKYDLNRGIVECDVEDAVFHCYLPTMDKLGFPFKVNADFSTDPSRKHIIWDKITEDAINSIALTYLGFLKRITAEQDVMKIYSLKLLNIHVAMGEMASKFEHAIDELLRKDAWILRGDGTVTTSHNVAYLPSWLDVDEKELLINSIKTVKNSVFDFNLYRNIDRIENIFSKYGVNEVSQECIRELLLSLDSIKLFNSRMIAKLFIYGYRGIFENQSIINTVIVPLENGFVTIGEGKKSCVLNPGFTETLNAILTNKEKEVLSINYAIFESIYSQSNNRHLKPYEDKRKTNSVQKNLIINKWKSPIQNCIAAEQLEGRTSKDVSKKNEGYSVESVDAKGEYRYIAVKQVKTLGDSFTLSEQEYSAAQRLGQKYQIFLISIEKNNVVYNYITNPLQILKLEKVVKEWEFICTDYECIHNSIEDEQDGLIDQRILKEILPEYFNTEQKRFLKDFLVMGKLEYSEKYKVIIENINGVIDFYTGDKLLEIKDNMVCADKVMVNTLRKILM